MKKFNELSKNKKVASVLIVILMFIFLVLGTIDILNEDNWVKQITCGDKVYNLSRDDPRTLEDICPEAFGLPINIKYETIDDIVNTTVEDLLIYE